MNPLLSELEKALAPLYKGLPKMPKNGVDGLTKAWPYIALIFGVLQLLAAWSLWHLGHAVSNLINATNQFYGTNIILHQSLGFFYWLSLAVLALDGVILLLAYTGLKARTKAGWNMLFLATLVNGVYGVLAAFDSGYGGLGRFLFAIVSTAIVLYFVFQVRSHYAPAKKSV